MVQRVKSKRGGAIVKDEQTGRFVKGHKGPGRSKGGHNKTTRVLKEAVILAAEQVGEDKRGKDGLLGYLRNIAKSDFKCYTQLLLKVLPLQVTGDPDRPVVLTLDEQTLAAMAKKSPDKLELLRDVLRAIGVTASGQIPAALVEKPKADPSAYAQSLRADSRTEGRA